MALATFKDLVIDPADPARLGRFWAELEATRRHVQDVLAACDTGNCAFEPSIPQRP